MKRTPSQRELLELFNYDKKTGLLTRKITRTNNVSVGDLVGTLRDNGYLRCRIGKSDFYVHRLIWVMVYGAEPDTIDHINGDRSDNRIKNLRSVKQATNLRNAKIRSDNKSGVTGVFWNKGAGKWQASIKGFDNNLVYLGLFDDIADAKSARKLAERKYGYHENHGKR